MSRAVGFQLIGAGESSQPATAACGASRATGYRLWQRFLGGRLRGHSPVALRRPLSAAPAAARGRAEILHWRCQLGADPAVTARSGRNGALVGGLLGLLLGSIAALLADPFFARRARTS